MGERATIMPVLATPTMPMQMHLLHLIQNAILKES
jgi:hypothetical protein